MAKTVDIKIRGYHLDLFGHVNNARYLEFLEEGRWAIFENGQGLEAFLKSGLAFNVVNINISYLRPAMFNDLLTVETCLEKMGNRSAVLRQKVMNKHSGETVADAQVTFVMTDIQKQKAALIDGELKESLMEAMRDTLQSYQV